MNAVSIPNSPSSPIVPATVPKVIALHDDEITKKACGSICFWSLSKLPIALPALVSALQAEGSSAIPPEKPSDVVALHRACQAVAKILELDLHGRERGKWALVGTPTMESLGGDSKLSYPVEATAELLENGSLALDGSDRFVEQLRVEYELARNRISSQDIGGWLCSKLAALDAVSLRPTGGFYFLPQPQVAKWEKIVRALKACSKHSIFSIPALKSTDAVDAILQAITADTEAACQKIASEIPTVGKRALESREKETAALLERAAKYENLLGLKLDGLRKVLDDTRRAVATAMLMSGSDDES